MDVVTGDELVPRRSPLARPDRRTGNLEEDLKLVPEVASDAMARLIAGATPHRPEAWKKAWQIIAARTVTVEKLERIMADVVESALETNENVKDRRKAQQLVLDAIDKLSADEAAYAKGQQPVMVQINFNEKPQDYLRVQGE